MENRIRQLRERKKITQTELSRRLNISNSYVNKLEQNKKQPSVAMAIKISEVLDSNLNDIFL